MESDRKDKTIAIVLAAGQGKRMNSEIHKQFLLIQDKPVLYYSLKALEESFVRHIVLVVGKDEIAYCKKNIVEKYGFEKVSCIVEGGAQRYHSVWNGICAISEKLCTTCDYIMIHDGARPFLTSDILMRSLQGVREYHACVAGMLSKDTIKIVDECGFCKETPNRNRVWNIQTPQSFSYTLIKDVYKKLIEQETEIQKQGISITDDAMVVETFTTQKVKMIEGSYQNIKITTPEDLKIAETFLRVK